ncbi:hypothetical protein MMC16_006752 [Acarospora aff. strigata]|nr:hypothetical protein [Acarospora aff. strigata]
MAGPKTTYSQKEPQGNPNDQPQPATQGQVPDTGNVPGTTGPGQAPKAEEHPTIKTTVSPKGKKTIHVTSKETKHKNGGSSVAEEQPPEPIRAHPFAGTYHPHFLSEWTGEDLRKYTHLNCSYFSHWTGVAPNLLQLKQHAQAICNLIKTLTIVDHENDTDDAFDWLDDLDTPYTNSTTSHSLPLNSVRNQIATAQDPATGADVLMAGCTLAEDGGEVRDLGQHIEHANTLLEFIDNECAADGGLLAILPAQRDPARAQIQDTILGQWLLYTTGLVQRVAELESEIVNSRDVLHGEAMVPTQLNSTGLMTEGRPLLFPQDRYVLANITPDLWDVLNGQLNAKQWEQEDAERVAASNLHAPPTKDSPQTVDPLKPVATIDVTSRLYRIPGSRTIFITPAHGIHPAVAPTLRNEKRPALVQTVVKPQIGTRITAQGRGMRRKLDEFHGMALRRGREVTTLKAALAAADADLSAMRHNLQLAQLRAGEGRESDRAHLGIVVEAVETGKGIGKGKGTGAKKTTFAEGTATGPARETTTQGSRTRGPTVPSGEAKTAAAAAAAAATAAAEAAAAAAAAVGAAADEMVQITR